MLKIGLSGHLVKSQGAVKTALLFGAATMALSAGSAPPGSTQATAKFGTNRVAITISGGERIISANGIPDHKPGNFPRRGNPNSISAQSYNLKVPSQPGVAAQPVSAGHALFGVAVNGVPFDPATAEFWNNDRNSGWNYEANTGFLNLGLDEHNAHVQPTGAYHYHGVPNGLIARLQRATTNHAVIQSLPSVTTNPQEGARTPVRALSGTASPAASNAPAKMLLIGWAADGFPIYTQYGHASPMDASSALTKLHASYRLKKGTRVGGPGGIYDGRFTADFEYVKDSGDLDECNGRFGVTPEYPQGIYHYYITEEFPFISRFWKGTPDASFMHRGPGPGGAAGRRGPGGRNGRSPGAESDRPPMPRPDSAQQPIDDHQEKSLTLAVRDAIAPANR